MTGAEVRKAYQCRALITHPRNNDLYEILDIIEMHIDGCWIFGATYRETTRASIVYARRLDEFQKFTLAF